MKYKIILKNNATIRYHIDPKNEWDFLPFPENNFDTLYHLFIANFSKFKYLTGVTSEEYFNNKTLLINASGTGRGGRGIYVGCGGRGQGGRGRVQVRVSPYNPYLSPSANNNIKI